MRQSRFRLDPPLPLIYTVGLRALTAVDGKASLKVQSPLRMESGASDVCEAEQERFVVSTYIEPETLVEKPVQSSMTGFLSPEPDTEITRPATIQQTQSNISCLLVTVESMAIKYKCSTSHSKSITQVSADIGTLKDADNYLEISHPEITIEVLEDGCRVIYVPCQQYVMS